MKLIKRRYIYICSLLLLIGGFAYLIIDFRLFPFHFAFGFCLTGFLLQILEKKIRWVSAMSIAGFVLVVLGSFFIANVSSIPLLYDLKQPQLSTQQIADIVLFYCFLALLPIGYILLTIGGNRASILDNVASAVLVTFFLINVTPFFVITRLLFGFAIITIGYSSLLSLPKSNRN